jgi:site-specific recombinase XerD
MADIIKRPDAQSPALLTEAAERYLRESLSPHTRRTYKGQMTRWQEWCERHEIDPWSGNTAGIVNYLSERANAGQAVSTIRTALAAIKFGHDAQGVHFDSRAPAIVKVLRGITRTSNRLQRQAEPIRAADAMTMITVADNANAMELRDAAVVAVGYLFALRRSELAGLDWGRHGDGEGVLRLTAKTLELTLVRSKTNNGNPEPVTIPRRGNEDAIAILKRWVEAGGITQASALFRRIRKGGDVRGRMTPQTVGLIVKKLGGEDYSGHSLRVGFAVSSAEAGVDLRSIATVTRHASMEMPKRYAERADQLRTSPYNADGVGLSRGSL